MGSPAWARGDVKLGAQRAGLAVGAWGTGWGLTIDDLRLTIAFSRMLWGRLELSIWRGQVLPVTLLQSVVSAVVFPDAHGSARTTILTR